MAILGVLLGITICGVRGCMWFLYQQYLYNDTCDRRYQVALERIAVLERRKTVISEAVAARFAAQEKPAGVGKSRPATWSQAKERAEAGDSN